MSKELVISSNRHETKVALIEDDLLCEVYFQRANEYSLAGSIHKGRVTRVLPGMQSAFVDLGLERDTFLYVSDFLEEHEDFDKVTGDERPVREAREPERTGRETAGIASRAIGTVIEKDGLRRVLLLRQHISLRMRPRRPSNRARLGRKPPPVPPQHLLRKRGLTIGASGVVTGGAAIVDAVPVGAGQAGAVFPIRSTPRLARSNGHLVLLHRWRAHRRQKPRSLKRWRSLTPWQNRRR